jgi:hypothetical protein
MKGVEWAYSNYIQFLATLALTITFQAGLHPPGGLWQENGDGHKAGDPILRSTNPRRYNAFFYCNSVAFVASLACMILIKLTPLLKHRLLEQAMILDLLGLVGAYAIGSCRESTATVYAVGICGAAIVYVVLHVALLGRRGNSNGQQQKEFEGDDVPLNSMAYGFFVFAIFVATITYQAGLTPPGGFLLDKDDGSQHHAGDPVLLRNYPRRYSVFFYCNSTSFMVSIAVIILLVSEQLYKPAIQTHALSVCTLVSFVCLMAAFAAGTTQHLKTSIYTLVLLAVVFTFTVLLLLLRPVMAIFRRESSSEPSENGAPSSKANMKIELIPSSKKSVVKAADDVDVDGNQAAESIEVNEWILGLWSYIYMMMVGILVASVTYQAGLDPPGGTWQGSSDGHDAGDPVMEDSSRQRYLIFFYCNSTSFVTSIFFMLLLLPMSMSSSWRKSSYFVAQKMMLKLSFLGLLGAYAAGSSRDWKTSVYVVAIGFCVLAYFSIHVLVLWVLAKKGDSNNVTHHSKIDFV